MAATHCSLPTEASSSPRYRRLSMLSRLKNKKKKSAPPTVDRRVSIGTSRLSTKSVPLITRTLSTAGLKDPFDDNTIEGDFNDLYRAIVTHVHKYYSIEEVKKGAPQAAIEHATSGLGIPWPQIMSLLGDEKHRLGALVLCIGWTISSRSLLLRLGMSNSPGSTFLPPEIVECFQSFSVRKCAVWIGEQPQSGFLSYSVPQGRRLMLIVDLALLSRWRQISAALMHSVYVDETMSPFDSRTVNIERALNDLDPLLHTYASSQNSRKIATARLDDLREVLRKGARFAFTLFGHASFWQFDWNSPDYEHDSEEHGKVNMTGSRDRTSVETRVVPAELVIWPSLLRVMDGEGKRVEREGKESSLGQKVILSNFE